MKASSYLCNFCIGIFLFATASTANAALTSILGGKAVYDSDLDITWLADANAGAGSVFDDGLNTNDGRMRQSNASAWAASLNVDGVTGWRLPTTLHPDATCFTISDSTGGDCTGSEMGHLFYNELGGTENNSILTSGDPDLELFSNLQSFRYWSATDYPVSTLDSYVFAFNSGKQSFATKEASVFYAWAVYDGNAELAAVPMPAAVWLFGSGFLGLAGMARRKKS